VSLRLHCNIDVHFKDLVQPENIGSEQGSSSSVPRFFEGLKRRLGESQELASADIVGINFTKIRVGSGLKNFLGFQHLRQCGVSRRRRFLLAPSSFPHRSSTDKIWLNFLAVGTDCEPYNVMVRIETWM
jgi:hypothetical protein